MADDFTALLANLFVAQHDTEDPNGSAKQQPPKQDKKDEDAERTAMASSFLKVSAAILIEQRKLALMPADNAVTKVPVQNGEAQTNSTTDKQLAFSLVLQLRDAQQNGANAGTDEGDDVRQNDSKEQPVNANPAPKIPAQLAITSASESGADHHGSTDPDDSSAIRSLPVHRSVEQPGPVFALQDTTAIRAAEQQPGQAVEKPHASLQTAPEQGLPGQQKTVQNLQIRLGDGPNEPVQIQISQHAGNVHVSVRSGDPGLTEPLRQNLPGLVENLERRGYRAESVSVNEPQTPAVIYSEVKAQTDQNQSGHGSQQGSSPHDQEQPKNRKKRAAAPDFSIPFTQIQEINT